MADKDKSNGTTPDAFGRVFTLKPDLRQRDVAAWNRSFIAHPNRKALADEQQANLQAAIEAGWIQSPDCRFEDVAVNGGKTERRYFFDGVLVDDLLAGEVYHYGRQVARHFEAAISVPKATSSR